MTNYVLDAEPGVYEQTMTEVAPPLKVLRVLHLGCGRKGRMVPLTVDRPLDVTSLDADPLLEPDIVCRLGAEPIPLPNDSVDLAVAFHVLEHIGRQGETAEWFSFFEDLYRVLTPGGELHFESPLYSSVWAWADPSHVRALSPQSFVFFNQDSYRDRDSGISPFRIRCDFVPSGFEGVPDSANPHIAASEGHSSFRGVLIAKKPLEPWWTD